MCNSTEILELKDKEINDDFFASTEKKERKEDVRDFRVFSKNDVKDYKTKKVKVKRIMWNLN